MSEQQKQEVKASSSLPDQGSPSEQTASDPSEGAPAVQEGTVTTPEGGDVAPSQPDAETEESGEGADPYEETLKSLERDYGHAERKITAQGQELSARDTENETLKRELAETRQQIQQMLSQQRQPTPQQFGYGNTNQQSQPDVTAQSQELAEMKNQLNMVTNALLDSDEKFEEYRETQTVTQREVSEKAQFAKATGDSTDRAWKLYAAANKISPVEGALVLSQIKDANVKQVETRRRRDAGRQASVTEGGGGGGIAAGSGADSANKRPEGMTDKEALRWAMNKNTAGKGG